MHIELNQASLPTSFQAHKLLNTLVNGLLLQTMSHFSELILVSLASEMDHDKSRSLNF